MDRLRRPLDALRLRAAVPRVELVIGPFNLSRSTSTPEPSLEERPRILQATTLASDQVYYYNRPVSEYAVHGYGPVLLAGSEVIRMLENPAFEIQYRLRTYHFVPKDGRATSYREHQ